jgi:GntR family transcriptional repressor for pyruvate dehydrogenase complex
MSQTRTTAHDENAPPSPLRAVVQVGPTEAVRRQLETALRDGAYAPGERLPSERELAETFGVSRVSVREAVRALVAVGLIRVHHGRGAFVADRRSGLGEPMARWLALHRDEVLELHDVRSALDELAAFEAARRSDAGNIEAIVATHDQFVAAVESDAPTDDIARRDIDFHLAIADAGGNRLLYDLLFDLNEYVQQTRRLVLTRGLVRNTDHSAIVDAVRAGDPDGARRAAAVHMGNVRAAIIAGMSEQADEPVA